MNHQKLIHVFKFKKQLWIANLSIACMTLVFCSCRIQTINLNYHPTGKIIKYELDSLVGTSDFESFFYLLKHPKGYFSREDLYKKDTTWKKGVDEMITLSKSYIETLRNDTLTWPNAIIPIINKYNTTHNKTEAIKVDDLGGETEELFFNLMTANRLQAWYKNGAFIKRIQIRKYKKQEGTYISKKIIDKKTNKILKKYRVIWLPGTPSF